MDVTRETFECLIPSLKIAMSHLKGSSRRNFVSQLAIDLGKGGQSMVSEYLGTSRDTIRKGIEEIKVGVIQADKFEERGRKPLEEKEPKLISDLELILTETSQTDPKFTSVRLYTRLTLKEIRNQLIKKGHEDEYLPTNETLRKKLHSLGYHLSKVRKTQPKKK
jgi:transposase